jgi:DNA gyrase subunit B
MVNGIVDESLYEAENGFVRSVSMTLRSDGSLRIQDDGRGLPAESLVAMLLNSYLNWNSIRIQRDTLPIAVACSLSNRLRIENRYEGRGFVQDFEMGIPLGPPTDLGQSAMTGIVLEFMPDIAIFPRVRLNSTLLCERLKECAMLHSGVRVSFLDESTRAVNPFFFEAGIRSFVTKLNESRTPLHDVAVFQDQHQGISFEVGVQFCDERENVMRGYVNDYRCDVGTHLTGVRVALTQSLKRFARACDSISNELLQWTSSDKGVTSLVSIRMAEPQFAGATKHKLMSSNVRKVLAKEVGKYLDEFFASNPDAATAIIREGLRQ